MTCIPLYGGRARIVHRDTPPMVQAEAHIGPCAQCVRERSDTPSYGGFCTHHAARVYHAEDRCRYEETSRPSRVARRGERSGAAVRNTGQHVTKRPRECGTEQGVFIVSSSAPLKEEPGMRRTVLLLFSAAVALLLASGTVLALPSERPDDTPMIDGRVRAIEQVGTNIWIGGRFSRVEQRNGTLLGNVANVAVFDSRTEEYRKGVAPTLGGTGAEVFDMTLYGDDVLIAGNFPGPTRGTLSLIHI